MKRYMLTALSGLCCAIVSSGAPLTVCDFEDFDIGTEWTLWRSNTSTATVEADPTNPTNKVLHIRLKDWGCHPEFVLPTELRGKALTDAYPSVQYDLYRSSNETDDWKQFAFFLGEEELYRDEGYPQQGDRNVWQTRKYDLASASEGNLSDKIRLGLHHNNTDYYIDNVLLIPGGAFGSFTDLEDGQTLDFCVDNTDKNYTTIGTDYYVGDGISANFIGSRYTQWTGRLAGSGTVNIYSGGERFYLGTKDSKGSTYPDWTAMEGNINIYPYTDVKADCGFYGLILHSGTFQPDAIDASRPNKMLTRAKVTLKEGARIAIENGTRGIRIGELNTEKGSVLDSYYKKGTANSYYLTGGLCTDATIAGTVAPQADGNKVGIIKEGTGSIRITGNGNRINGGIRLLKGSLIIDNDAKEAELGKLSGGTGNEGNIFVFRGTTLAGVGSVGCRTEIYGSLVPGSYDSPGILTFADFTGTTMPKLVMHPKSKLVCKIAGRGNAGGIKLAGSLIFDTLTQELEVSEKAPRLVIDLQDGADLAQEDEFILVETDDMDPSSEFDIRYPKRYTWKIERRTDGEGVVRIVAVVTSLEYSGQGDGYEDDDDDPGQIDNGSLEDWTYEDLYVKPLRKYADKLGKSIGVAVGTYRYDCSHDDGACGLVGKEFNLIVAENEMKFDATEPQNNSFTFGGADAVMGVGERNNQEVRGHTLAWHSQISQWVSKDGYANDKNLSRQQLLDILKNHIFNVVGRYKGRIREWDVANEVLDDDQSQIWSEPGSYKMRQSVYMKVIGEDFIDSAFVWTKQADPDALLYINDYGVEFKGSPKAEAYFNLVKRLKESGVPIDGCGLQCHLTTGQLNVKNLEDNIARYADLGLNCIITELDISLANPADPEALDNQAKEYAEITNVFLRNDNCPSMVLWGISDNNSWRSNQPLLFDNGLNPKPAYYAVHAQLRRAAEAESIEEISGANESPVVESIFYDMTGKRVDGRSSGLVIRIDVHADGTRSARKIIAK